MSFDLMGHTSSVQCNASIKHILNFRLLEGHQNFVVVPVPLCLLSVLVYVITYVFVLF